MKPRPPLGAILAIMLIAISVVVVLNIINRAIWKASSILALGIEIALIVAFLWIVFVWRRR